MGMPQPAIASGSLGLPGIHGFAQRLAEIARIGFKGVEILDDDLDSFATQLPGGVTKDQNRLAAAEIVKKACDRLGLTIIVFQPFRFFEGRLDREAHAAMIAKLRLWLKLAKVLGTEMIQLPTNWLDHGTTGDSETVVRDLREMADLGLSQKPVIRFAYEAVAWGTHHDTWQDSWNLAKKVNRQNFGLCLDTFHIAARVYGDPLRDDGKAEHAEQNLENSMKELISEVDVRKVFYVQAGDAQSLDWPLDQTHPFYDREQKPRMSWSRNARLFAFEEHLGGCLPIERIMKAIVIDLGYDGWISMELFSKDKLRDPDARLPALYADRAQASWRNLCISLGINN